MSFFKTLFNTGIIIYTILKPIIKVLFYTLYRPKVTGIENLPKEGPFVLAGNHTNNLDSVMLIAVVSRQVHFLAKIELFKGIFGVIVRGLGCIPVNRKIHDKDALKSAKDVLSEGSVIGIFPEGTINRTNDIIMPFKIGAVKMAKDTNCYIVPFAITGKYRLFNNHLQITFTKPYKISSPDLEEENKILMNKVSNLIMRGKENGDN